MVSGKLDGSIAHRIGKLAAADRGAVSGAGRPWYGGSFSCMAGWRVGHAWVHGLQPRRTWPTDPADGDV